MAAVSTQVVPLGVERRVTTLVGALDQLLADPAHAGAEGCWVRARLTDEVLPRHAMARLRDRFPHAVVLEHRSPAAGPAGDDIRTRDEATTDLALALAFVAEHLGRPAEPVEEEVLARAFAVAAAAPGRRASGAGGHPCRRDADGEADVDGAVA